MKKELALNDNQYSQVKSLDEKFLRRYSATRQDTALTRGTMSKKIKAIHVEQDLELQKVLTADQATKWAAMKAERKDARRTHHSKEME